MVSYVQHLHQTLSPGAHGGSKDVPYQSLSITEHAFMPAAFVSDFLVMSQPVNAYVAGRTSQSVFPTLAAIVWTGMNRVLSLTPLSAKVQRVHALPKDCRNTWLQRKHHCHWRGWQFVSCNSVWQHKQRVELFGCRPLHGRCQSLAVKTVPFFVDCVRVDVSSPTIRLMTTKRSSGSVVKWSVKYLFMSCSSLTLFAADG